MADTDILWVELAEQHPVVTRCDPYDGHSLGQAPKQGALRFSRSPGEQLDLDQHEGSTHARRGRKRGRTANDDPKARGLGVSQRRLNAIHDCGTKLRELCFGPDMVECDGHVGHGDSLWNAPGGRKKQPGIEAVVVQMEHDISASGDIAVGRP